MKAMLLPLLAVFIMPGLALRAEPPADFRAPKAEDVRYARIFLYIPGSSRIIDYPDVERIISCEKDRITFETQDGHTILHHGPYTVIQPRTASNPSSNGPRFYDVK